MWFVGLGAAMYSLCFTLRHGTRYEVDPAVTCLAFGCTKSLDVAEVRLPTAAILESTLRWCP